MRKRARQGIALVVVLLVGAVLLLSVVTSTAVSALGAKRGTSSEQARYATLLGAESGLNTFEVSATANQPPGSVLTVDDAIDDDEAQRRAAVEDNLNAWLATAGLASIEYDNGVQVNRRIALVDDDTATLIATATLGRSEVKVARDFDLDAALSNLNLKARAPLISKPNITVNGNASLTGVEAVVGSWTYEAGSTTGSATVVAGSPFDLSVSAVALEQVKEGEFVELELVGSASATRFEILAIDAEAGTLELQAVDGTASGTVTNGTGITHIPYAPREAVTSDETPFEVTRVTSYSELERIVVADDNGNDVEGLITNVDEENGTITVNWDTDPSVTAIAPGSPIRRHIVGAISDGYIYDKHGTISPEGEQYANLPSAYGQNELFQSIFDATPDEMEQLASSRGTSYGSWDDVPNVESLSGVTYVRSGSSNNIQYCGSGILIVEGNLRTNNAPCGFTGVIYVMGEWFEKGNRQIIGSVITEGEAEVCLDDDLSSTCDETTDLRGTGDKIRYDPDAVYNAGLDQYPSTIAFVAVSDSWRQGYE